MGKNSIIGRTFGQLTVVAEAEPAWEWVRRRRVTALCTCGSERAYRADRIGRGDTVSCGCYHKARATAAMRQIHRQGKHKTHGDSKSAEYRTWARMIDRCENPRRQNYAAYGGRGIKVCARWRRGEDGKSGYECFLEDVGRKPSRLHSIDRIKVNRDYEPGNVRWATDAQQRANKRSRAKAAGDTSFKRRRLGQAKGV